MVPESLPTPRLRTPDALTLPPVVLWHYLGSPLQPADHTLDTRNAYGALHKVVSESIESTVAAVSSVSGMTVRRNGNFRELLTVSDLPNPNRWFAYTCLDEDAGRTDELIGLIYGIWLGVHGDGKLLDTAVRQSEALNGIGDISLEPKRLREMLGGLVVPDLVHGVMPGTSWIPTADTMSRPAWPAMPDERTAASWRQRYTKG